MAAVQEASAPRAFRLRLDDGTVIKAGDKPTVLKPAEAWKAGMLTEDHLIRAQALLCEMHAKLPDEVDGLKSMSTSTKRSMDSVLEMHQVASAKRSRSVASGGPVANGNGIVAPAPVHTLPPAPVAAPVAAPAPVHVASAPVAAPPAPDFTRGCKALVDYLLTKVLGPVNAPIFKTRVDPRQVADYYQIIKKPICFDDIIHKLDHKQYGSAADFYRDVDQLLQNCFTYNAADSTVGQVGMRLESAFDAAWAKLPFAHVAPAKQQRHYRYVNGKGRGAAAGRGIPRGGGGGGGSPFGAAPRRGRVGRPPGSTVNRTRSVNSYQNLQPMSTEKAQELANAMQDETIMEAKMNGVVEILQKANELPTNEDGEVELDISALSVPVTWTLYNYVIKGMMPVDAPPAVNGGGGAAHGHALPARSAGGFQMEGEDSDYDPLDEEDE